MIRRLEATLKLAGAVLVALGAGSACDRLVDPPLPGLAVRLTPPPVYARWWSMVESCSGLNGSLDAIQWYSTPGPLMDPTNNEEVNGYWSKASNRIVLDQNDTIDGAVVRHEMLHSLLRVAGHPRSAFLDNCGGVVACSVECVREAGDVAHDPSLPFVNASQLIVTSEVSPASPSASVDGGLATFTIIVHNPFPQAVGVNLPSNGGVAPQSYRYEFRQTSAGGGATGVEHAIYAGVTVFKAGETKRQVIDFLVIGTGSPTPSRISGLGNSGIALPAGPYSFRGDYGGKFAPDLSLVLTP